MAFEELRERLKDEWQKSLEKAEESRVYTELKDRYENLTPVQQKIMLGVTIGTVLLVLFSIPYSSFSTSEDSLFEFTEKRQLIRDLLRTSKEAKESPEIPVPPAVEDLRAQAEGMLTTAQLLPEQIAGVTAEGPHGGIVNGQLVSGNVRVAANQLNLRQIVDLGHEFSSISPSAKLKDLQITASKEPGYFDVVYRILVLKVKPKEIIPVEDEKPKKGRK